MGLVKTTEHKFKASVFWIFKRFFKKGTKSIDPLDVNQLTSILLIRPDKLGDLVCTFPFIDELKKQYSHLKISIVVSKLCLPLVKDDPRFDNIFLYQKKFTKDLINIIKIRRYDFDCIVDMISDDSVTSLLLSQISAKGKPRIGMGKKKHAQFYELNYDYAYNKNHQGKTGHMIDTTLNILSAFDVYSENADKFRPPFISSTNSEIANNFVGKIVGTNKGIPAIGYNLSSGKERRSWSLEKSKKLIESILSYCNNCQIILFSTPSERYRPEKLVGCFQERVSIIPDKLSILQVSAIIKQLDLMISPDTSIIHIARSFKIPVVGLYQKENPDGRNYRKFFPYDQSDSVVNSDSMYNIFEITPQEVFNKFVEVFEKSRYKVS
jgi:ADP-heptose:LPS heptosyltransferase